MTAKESATKAQRAAKPSANQESMSPNTPEVSAASTTLVSASGQHTSIVAKQLAIGDLVSSGPATWVDVWSDPTCSDAEIAHNENEDLIVVGCPMITVNNMLKAGVVHLYSKATNALKITFNSPKPGYAEMFGQTVQLSGSTLAEGAPCTRLPVRGACHGAVYIIADINVADPAKTMKRFTSPTPSHLGYFGMFIILSGSTLVVTAYGDKVYLVPKCGCGLSLHH